MQQEDEYQKLLELCKNVIPITWNVYKYCDIRNSRKEKGILNIELIDTNSIGLNGEKHTWGHVEYIRYLNGVGYSKIYFHSYPIQKTSTLLHELAHIAVFRLQSLITKSYKEEFALSSGKIVEPDSHGKIFLRFLNIFENRAIKKGWSFFAISKDKKIWSKDSKGA